MKKNLIKILRIPSGYPYIPAGYCDKKRKAQEAFIMHYNPFNMPQSQKEKLGQDFRVLGF